MAEGGRAELHPRAEAGRRQGLALPWARRHSPRQELRSTHTRGASRRGESDLSETVSRSTLQKTGSRETSEAPGEVPDTLPAVLSNQSLHTRGVAWTSPRESVGGVAEQAS